MRIQLVAMITSVLALAGCGEDKATALEAIYTISSHTKNTMGCDVEGPATSSSNTHLFIREFNFFGERGISLIECDTLAECQEKAAEKDTLFLSGFFFEPGDDTDGHLGDSYVLGGTTGGPCSGKVMQMKLTGIKGQSITARRESRTVTDIPRDGDGDCDDAKAKAQAAPKACDELEVIQGTFLEGI